MMMWGYNDTWPMLWMAFWNLLWLVLLGLLVWALVRWLVRSPTRGGFRHPSARELDAFEILRQRYASGEIDMVTFEQMRERLEASREREKPSM